MTRNVEIKARVYDVAVLIERAVAITGSGLERIEQDDTFFVCANGRLKLRQFSPERGKLIRHFHTNSTGPQISSYHIVPTNAPDALRDTLTTTIGTADQVIKVRQLYLTGQARVHVNTVKDLGDFVELEVVLRKDQSEDDGVAIAHALMQSLGIAEFDLLNVAYIDLLAVQQH